MPASGIVKLLNITEHICPDVIPTPVGSPVQPLTLQAREEAFHGRIVPAITAATQTAFNPVQLQQALKQRTRVLAALVGMMQQGLTRTASPSRHHQGIGDQLRTHP